MSFSRISYACRARILCLTTTTYSTMFLRLLFPYLAGIDVCSSDLSCHWLDTKIPFHGLFQGLRPSPSSNWPLSLLPLIAFTVKSSSLLTPLPHRLLMPFLLRPNLLKNNVVNNYSSLWLSTPSSLMSSTSSSRKKFSLTTARLLIWFLPSFNNMSSSPRPTTWLEKWGCWILGLWSVHHLE